MYAIFCLVFMDFNTSSVKSVHWQNERWETQPSKHQEHARRPFSSLISVNQYTDLATLFFSNHQPNMECGQANILEQVTDPDNMIGKCRHAYGGNQAQYAITVENKSSDHNL